MRGKKARTLRQAVRQQQDVPRDYYVHRDGSIRLDPACTRAIYKTVKRLAP